MREHASRSVSQVSEHAWREVDGSSLAVFRALFGLVGLVTVARFFSYGWIDQLYVAPEFHFTYYGFSWVEAWPGIGMHLHFAALGVVSAAVMLGYRYRLAMTLFFLGFTYVELIDKTTYLNHYYWVSLASFVAIFLPLNAAWSIDRWRGRVSGPETLPALALWTARGLVGIVYIFAGLAKLNGDWLLRAQPLHIWLNAKTSFPVIGPWMDELWMAYAFSWGGALFDLTIVGWLLWRRSRPVAYVFVLGFHIATWMLFPIGVFPWLMISGALLFFGPDWPRRLISRAFRSPSFEPDSDQRPLPQKRLSPGWRKLALVAVIALLVAQVIVPFRHIAYPGDTRWTEEGYRFGWRVLLTEKTGFVEYRVVDPSTGRTWLVNPDRYLTPLQIERSAFRPDMILETAHIIADDFRVREGLTEPQVFADAFVAMNGNASRRLIDPEADLASINDSLSPKPWILRYS